MKAIIFDFDGTIADSFDVFVETLIHLTKRAEPLPPGEIEALRKLSITETMHRLHIKKWQVPLLLIRGRRHISTRITQIDTFPGLPEVLHELSGRYQLYILSTNSRSNITKFLAHHHLAAYFHKVYGGSGLAGKAKSLQRLLRRERLTAAGCLYVGDEPRDIEAAHRAGLRCIAVKWGYAHHESLSAHHPDALAATPAELPHIIIDF